MERAPRLGVAEPVPAVPIWNLPPSAWNSCQPAQPMRSPPAIPMSQPITNTAFAPKSPSQPSEASSARAALAAAMPPTSSISDPLVPGSWVCGAICGWKTMKSIASASSRVSQPTPKPNPNDESSGPTMDAIAP